MKAIISVSIDGLTDVVSFKIQEDNWYYNQDFQLSINLEENICLVEDATGSPIKDIPFKVLTTEDMLVEVYDRTSKNSKPLDDDFNKILSENIFELF